MTLVYSLFVPHLFFFWCPVKAVNRNCGTFQISSFIFLTHLSLASHKRDIDSVDPENAASDQGLYCLY